MRPRTKKETTRCRRRIRSRRPTLDANQSAFNETKAQRAALDASLVAPPRGLDPEKATNFGIDLAAKISQANWQARFRLLPAELFDPALLDLFLPAARAVVWSRNVLSDALAGERAARLPQGLVQDATALREAMLKLATYHLGTDPIAGPIVADIRQGTGYEDLAQDLERLANLYGTSEALLSKDPYYSAGDAARARELASKIRKELGAGASATENQAQDDAARAWTLFVQTHEEVVAAGRFLWRKEKGDALFPSLFQVSRAPKSRTNPGPTPPPTPPTARQVRRKGPGGLSAINVDCREVAGARKPISPDSRKPPSDLG